MTTNKTTSNQMTPGMTISLDGKIYRVESCAKVSVAKGVPFIKAKLKDLISEDMIEKNFKLNQPVQDVALIERRLAYLYLEGKDYLFLDVGCLDQVLVPGRVIGEKVNYLKEGIELKAMFYGDTVFSVELPQFLEIMIAKTETAEDNLHVTNATKPATLETGAKVYVPLYIEAGDVIKVDTQDGSFVQRV